MSILKKSRTLNSNFYKDDFYFSVITNKIDKTIFYYNTHLKNVIINWQQTIRKQFPIKPIKMGSSATFIVAVLVNYKIQPKVKFIQKGDSLAVVFRKTESAKKGQFYYLPVYMTTDNNFDLILRINSAQKFIIIILKFLFTVPMPKIWI